MSTLLVLSRSYSLFLSLCLSLSFLFPSFSACSLELPAWHVSNSERSPFGRWRRLGEKKKREKQKNALEYCERNGEEMLLWGRVTATKEAEEKNREGKRKRHREEKTTERTTGLTKDISAKMDQRRKNPVRNVNHQSIRYVLSKSGILKESIWIFQTVCAWAKKKILDHVCTADKTSLKHEHACIHLFS